MIKHLLYSLKYKLLEIFEQCYNRSCRTYAARLKIKYKIIIMVDQQLKCNFEVLIRILRYPLYNVMNKQMLTSPVGWMDGWPLSFSSPEAALLLVSTKNRDLWPSPTMEVSDSWTSRHSAHAQSQVWQIWLVLVSIYCLQIHSKPECRWTWPEVAILGADQKERGLWGREWTFI